MLFRDFVAESVVVFLYVELLRCLEIALDEAARNPPTDTSTSDQVTTSIPSLSVVPLGIALSHLIERETPRFADLVRLGQSLSDFKRMGSDTLLTRNRIHLKTPQVIDDNFNCALKGYVALLSPEMPPQLKEVRDRYYHGNLLSSLFHAVLIHLRLFGTLFLY